MTILLIIQDYHNNMERNQEKIIRECLKQNNSFNIIKNNATNVVIHNDTKRVLYDAPTIINSCIYINKDELSTIEKQSKYIEICPTHIKYIVSRDNFEEADKLHDTTFKYNIETLINMYNKKMQKYLLYGNSNDIDGLLTHKDINTIIYQSSDINNISTKELESYMMQMRGLMINNLQNFNNEKDKQ